MPWWGLLVLALMADAMADPLLEAQARFRALVSYQVTVRATAADGERQVMRYFYRQPGWVKMEFVQPHRGLVMVYDPTTRKLRLWPFGQNHMLVLSLAPDNPLLRHPRGHRIDRSDAGALLANLLTLRARGRMAPLADMDVATRPASGYEIAGDAGISVAGVHRYQVWLARDTLFPLRVESYDGDGGLIETVDMADVEIDVPFPDRFFTP